MKKALLVLALVGLVAAPLSAAPRGTDLLDVIVVLHDGAAGPSDVARDHGVAARHTFRNALNGFAASLPARAIENLERDSRVARVELDGAAWALMGPPGGGNGGNCLGNSQSTPWGVARVGGAQAVSSSVHTYILDSGIDSDHPDLAAALGNGFAAENCKGKGCNQNWDDDNGHGTHVAGTVGAIDNNTGVVGVAPGTTLHAVKVLNKSGSGSFSGIAAGIDWVTAEITARGAAAVGNMSLGGGGSKTGTCSNGSFSGTGAMHEALCNAAAAGLVTAVAAGNGGNDATADVPAAYDDAVITVSATNSSDDWPSWSSWGNDSASWTSNNSAPVAIAAPGVSIPSTWNDGCLNTISGTSMASPHVAGAIAIYLDQNNVSNNFSAFTGARSSLLNGAESTAGFSNTSGNPHDEDFLNP